MNRESQQLAKKSGQRRRPASADFWLGAWAMSAIRAGYKQTEVGVIPEDWRVACLGELANTSSGTTPARAQAEKYFSNGTIQWVKTLDLTNGSITETDEAVTPAALAETCLQLYPIGTVLVAMYGGYNQIGRTGMLETQACVNQALTAIRTDRKQLYPRFLLNILNYRVDYWRSVASSSRKDPNITSNDVRAFPLPVPPVAEQEAIAEALSDADALIESLEQLLTKKRHLKQAAMQELLTGKKRLPGFSGEWEVKRLGNVCSITTGKKDVNEGNPVGQYPFFTCARTNTFSDSYSFEGEAILIAGNGEVGNLSYCDGKFEAYQRTYVLQGFTANVGYLWQQLSAYLANSLGIGKIGSSIPYIKMGNLVGFEFRSPRDVSEQIAIAVILSDMDAELADLETQLDKSRALKQGMMQKLLTGEIRLL